MSNAIAAGRLPRLPEQVGGQGAQFRKRSTTPRVGGAHPDGAGQVRRQFRQDYPALIKASRGQVVKEAGIPPE